MIITTTASIICALTAIVVCSLLWWGSLFGALYSPFDTKKVERMFHALGLSQKCKFIDLGSGDGRIVFLAATQMKWQSTGVEIHPLLVLFSRLINLIFFKKSVRFVHQNIFKHDLSPYQIVYFYVQPAMFTKLITKILSECKRGTIIVSARFKLPHLKLIKTIDNVYAYRI